MNLQSNVLLNPTILFSKSVPATLAPLGQTHHDKIMLDLSHSSDTVLLYVIRKGIVMN
jgi:hypothetical protein